MLYSEHGKMHTEPVPELRSTQEEAETWMMLCAAHADGMEAQL